MFGCVLLALALPLGGASSSGPARDGTPTSSNAAGAELPKRYVCYRAGTPVTVDGRLDDPAWSTAPW